MTKERSRNLTTEAETELWFWCAENEHLGRISSLKYMLLVFIRQSRKSRAKKKIKSKGPRTSGMV